MEVVEIVNEALAKEFLMLPVKMYKGDANYIRPLDQDINSVFDKKKNKFFRHGQLKRWLLKKDGRYVGRVAAFINKKTKDAGKQPVGGMGFFECENNQESANFLFDTCRDYLKREGVEAMDGPINFGERDKFWGLLIEPFDPPTYTMNYNFPYYQELFENYGFEVYFKQFTYKRPVSGTLDSRIQDKSDRIAKNPKYSFRYIEKSKLPEYAEYFREVYNDAWGSSRDGFKGMSKEQAVSIMKTMKPVMVEELVWFGFYDDQPVCFFIMLPELNRIFKHVNGELDWFGKLKFAWYRYVVPIRHTYGVVFGVIKEHQKKGVEGAMIMAVANYLQPKNKYESIEMNWIGDFNPKMINVVQNVGGIKYRTYHTYRYLFDRNQPFERMVDVH